MCIAASSSLPAWLVSRTRGASAVERLVEGGDDVQRLVVDLDGGDAVLGGGVGLGEHDGDEVAGVEGLADGERRLRRIAVLVLGERQVVGGEDGDDAGDGEGGGLVDAVDAGVGVGAADGAGVEQAGQRRSPVKRSWPVSLAGASRRLTR